MGYVYVDVLIRGIKASRSVKMLVDTGATYMVVDEGLARELGLIELPYSVGMTLADKRRISARLYVGEVELKGRRGPTLMAAFDVPVPLLGLYALESLGLKPNPQSGEVEVIGPEGGYLLPVQ